MTQKEYREAEGISRSELFKIARSPMHFKYAMENPEDSPSRAFGRALHKYILEKDDFSSDFIMLPEINRRTKDGKEEYAKYQIEALNSGKELVTRDDMSVIIAMHEAVMSHALAKKLLTGEHEKDFFWVDATTGEKCKCRPDCLTEYDSKKYIVDYKSTDSCEDGHFERSCRKYGYKFQAGMYTEGVFQNTFEQYGFAFVAQEKKPPYAVRVYFCTPEFVAQGYDQFRELIGIYHNCKETRNFYGYEGAMNNTYRVVGGGFLMEKTHWKKLDNPDYLGAYALQPGQDLIAQIKSVGQEEVYNPTNNKKEVCTIVRFTDKNVKPMILNVTNCKTISKVYDTPYIEDWVGKYISIYIAKVKAFGETVEALRIRNRVPTVEKIYCEDCKREIAGVSGKTAEDIADIAVRNCGRKLCVDCMKKEKQRMENRSGENE